VVVVAEEPAAQAAAVVVVAEEPAAKAAAAAVGDG
jgi:hypothetical protein